jgi:tetratricopeptide (TPR) repeat protein
MTPDVTRKLVDHLDESLRGKATASLEDIIGNDPEAEKEWNYLRLAVGAVKEAGLYQEVSAARAAWKAELEVAANATDNANTSNTAVLRSIPAETAADTSTTNSAASTGKVRSFYRYSVRAAAVILIITSSAVIYKYLSISSSSLYDRYYNGYSFNTTRGAGDADAIVEAYNAKDWTTVRQLAATAKTRTNQTDFLAGMASLEQKQYDEAISHFEQIIAVNTHAGTDLYQDEAEYYLAISWLAHRSVNEAMPILEKIRADQHHKFHEKVEKMSFFDLRLAQYKENK